MTANKFVTDVSQTSLTATLLVTTNCPHCPTVLSGLTPLIKSGRLAELKIININEQPSAAEHYNTRTVPWLELKFPLGHFELEGLFTEAELKQWCINSKSLKGISEYCLMLLDQGKIQDLTKLVILYPDWLHATLLLVEDPDTSLTIRVGISAILESLEAAQFNPIYEALIMMTNNNLARIRSDACFYLSLTKNLAAIETLKICTKDENKEVREIAIEAIEDLQDLNLTN